MSNPSRVSVAARDLWRRAWPYVVAVAGSFVLAFPLLQLRRADLEVPFLYGGDALFYLMVIKSILVNGWYLHNDALGMPFGTDLHDFPMPDNLSYLLIKLIGFAVHDPAVVLNLFFLLTFGLVSATAYWALRRLAVSTGPALCCALLYSFSNYHVTRQTNHLMYSAYFAVPLVIVLALSTGGVARRIGPCTGLAICAITASSGGVYYTFFGLFVLAGAALLAGLERRSWRAGLVPLAYAACLVLMLVLEVLPTLRYRQQHGAVPVAVREVNEAETYGLKLAQLVLPVQGHRIETFAALRRSYDAGPLNNENADCSLGTVGALGFLALLAWLLFARAAPRPRTDLSRLLDHLSVHSTVGLLVGTVGGLGALFALLVTPQIRGCNRVSTFLLFLALCPVAVLLERLVARARARPWTRAATRGLLVAVTIFGLLDQVPGPWPGRELFTRWYRDDLEFFRRVEAQAPAGSMVFVLPIDTFPEGVTYDGVRPYVLTDGLRWSSGAVRYRPAWVWQERVTRLPHPRMIETLVTAGFTGMVVDRLRSDGGGEGLRRALVEAGAPAPIGSRDERWWYFDLRAVERRLRSAAGDAQWAARRETALHLPALAWSTGFAEEKTLPGHAYRWCGAKGTLRIERATPATDSVRVDLHLSSVHPGTVRITGPGFRDELTLLGGGQAVPWARAFALSSEPQELTFECNAPLAVPPDHGKPVAFCVDNLTVFGLPRD